MAQPIIRPTPPAPGHPWDPDVDPYTSMPCRGGHHGQCRGGPIVETDAGRTDVPCVCDCHGSTGGG